MQAWIWAHVFGSWQGVFVGRIRKIEKILQPKALPESYPLRLPMYQRLVTSTGKDISHIPVRMAGQFHHCFCQEALHCLPHHRITPACALEHGVCVLDSTLYEMHL